MKFLKEFGSIYVEDIVRPFCSLNFEIAKYSDANKRTFPAALTDVEGKGFIYICASVLI